MLKWSEVDRAARFAAGYSDRRRRQRGPQQPAVRVLQAAIRAGGAVHALAPPARHHTIIHQLAEQGFRGLSHPDGQGFVLSDGRFVDRQTAYRVAVAAGQLANGAGHVPGMLFTEDLW